MRVDKTSSLKQRLRRATEAFEFSALIEGVSTLDDGEQAQDPGSADGPLYGSPIDAEPPPPAVDTVAPTPAAAPPPENADRVVAAGAAIPVQQPLASRPPAGRYGARAADREERLCVILDALGRRLLSEAAHFRLAMQQRDAAGAGERLAHINQLCELLHSVDPSGDLGRQIGVAGAPPVGRGWPASAWSAAEFASSPFSALLPADTSSTFLGDMMYSAWGVQVERGQPA